MNSPTPLTTTPASWVIRDRATGRVICETFSAAMVKYLPPAYEAVPILEYLQSVAKAAKDAS